MEISINLNDVNNARNDNADIDVIVSGFNAQVGAVDLANPSDFTSAAGKIVVNANDFFDLRQTLRYRLAVVVGDDPADGTANSAVTEAHHATFMPMFADVIARFKIYCIMHSAGVPFGSRAVDHVNAAGAAARRDAYLAKVYAEYNRNQTAQVQIASQVTVVSQAMFMNASHRIQQGGHSWFTQEASRANTPTGKLHSIAGKDRGMLKDYMAEFGHDANHHLTTQCLMDYCDAMSGRVLASTSRAAVGVTGAVRNYVNLEYMGVADYMDYVHNIISPGKAAIDRWPATPLGTSAVIVGLNYILAMISHVMMHVKVTDYEEVPAQIQAVLSSLTSGNGVPDRYEEVETAFSGIMSIAYGYCDEANLLEDNAYLAFRNHAARIPAQVATGRSFATTVAAATPHEEAVTGAVTNIFTRIGEVANAAGSIRHAHGVYGTGDDANYSAIDAEVGASAQNNMIELMNAVRGQGAGQPFN